MTYEITKIARYLNDKNGQPLKTRDGRPYIRINMQLKEYGDKWISGFGNKDNETWREGDKVDVAIEEKGGSNGVVYLNFTMPKKEDAINEKLEQVLNRLTGISIDIQILKDAVVTPEKRKEMETRARGYEYPENTLEQSPF